MYCQLIWLHNVMFCPKFEIDINYTALYDLDNFLFVCVCVNCKCMIFFLLGCYTIQAITMLWSTNCKFKTIKNI